MLYAGENLVILEKWINEGLKELEVSGLSGTARSFFLSSLLSGLDKPSLIVLPNAREAKRLFKHLEFFLPRSFVRGDPDKRRLYDFPLYDISPLKGIRPPRDLVARRLQGLYSLYSGKNSIVVTSIEAALLKVMPKEAMTRALEYLVVGEEVNREDLLQRLEVNGFSRTSLVEERGDYSVRGGVIDVFPPLYAEPVRVEFWGDRVESIRHFETTSQRSTQHMKEVVLLPANEIIMDEENVQRARSIGRIPTGIGGSVTFAGQEAWLNHYYAHLNTLFDYLPENGVLILVDSLHFRKDAQSFIQKFEGEAQACKLEAEERNAPFPDLRGIVLSSQELDEKINQYQRLSLNELSLVGKDNVGARRLHVRGGSPVDADFEISLPGKGRVSMAPVAEKIFSYQEQGLRVVLVCRTEQQAERLKQILKNYHVELAETVSQWGEVSTGRGLSICLGRLDKGFAWPEAGLLVISEDEIFGPKRSVLKAGAKAPAAAPSWTSLSQLKVGDFVVHQDHGIGRYGGLCKLEIGGTPNDFVLIEYAGNDRLYIPATRISILQKYIGADETSPRLDHLGGRSWDIAKKRAKRSIREIAKQLVEIYALRKCRKGYAFSRPDSYYREFEATFEHEETADQIKAIEDVLEDMEEDQPMDRLVCGDVGFGKTEVAIRASFKAVMDGKQVAVLVPTTVLAEQHYETFGKRMCAYGIQIAVLSRFKKKAEQKEIIGKLRSGKIDILIGTHRLLQKDVQFKDLGLLIIDEEQRFGVRQKEKIKRYRALVDVLALSATPIPRTLHMSLMGIRDLSLIETPPADRMAIQTHLTTYDEDTVQRAIENELQRGGQVFFVHNSVQTIERVAEELKRLVPQARFAIAHGQMKEKDLEQTMIRFHKRDIDVLVCTTIIESGLDIPTVNTIIINEVERFGLSQIYQLRGRVGRSSKMAYAYLLLSDGAHLTRDAEKRLRALMDFSHLGAGIHLAMHDLRIRGGGNILGFSQSGHISAIGYELYLKLIEQSIAELKGEEWHEEINPEINLNLPAYLPSDYVSDMDVRLNLYRRLSKLCEPEELEVMKEELLDRFGPLPPEVTNLMHVMSVRLLLKKAGISRLDINRGAAILTFSENTRVEPEILVRAAREKTGKFQFLSERKVKLRIANLSPLEKLLGTQEVIHSLLLCCEN